MSIEHKDKFSELCDALADAMETTIEEGVCYEANLTGIHICLVLDNVPTFRLETGVRQILFGKINREDFQCEIESLIYMIRAIERAEDKPFTHIVCNHYFGKRYPEGLALLDQARIRWLRDLAQGRNPL